MSYTLLGILTHALNKGRLANNVAYILIYHVIPVIRENQLKVVGGEHVVDKTILTCGYHQQHECQNPFSRSVLLRLGRIVSVETLLGGGNGQDDMKKRKTRN